jgi:hypothetical protein
MRNLKGEKRRPPRLLEWILKRFLQEDEAYEKLGDFEEAYREYLKAGGRFPAAVWYLLQIVKAVPSFLSNSFYGSTTMFKNHVTAAFRNLTRNKLYSFLNTIGLAVGFAAFLMIFLYVSFELSYDRFHKNADRIFTVISKDQAVTPAPLAPALMEEFPEVEAATRLCGISIAWS